MNVTLLVPPAMDWSMPLIALPLLKTYLPDEWNVKVLDLNAKLFSSQYGSYVKVFKKKFMDSIDTHDLLRAVDLYLELEEKISSREIGSATLRSRGLSTIDEWFDSNKVFDYLQSDHTLFHLILKVLKNNLTENKNDVFGISITIEEQIVPSFIVCSLLRKECPNSKIILGGNIVSRLYKNLLKSKLSMYFDLLIIGEGEAILKQAIDYVTSNRYDKFKVYKNDVDINNDVFSNLNTPNYSNIIWEEYLSPYKVLPITAQRKCQWGKCDFCAIHSCWTYGCRERNVDLLADEIEDLILKYDVKYFRIVDEMVSAEYLYQLSVKLIERNIKIYYEAYVRFEKRFLDEGVLKVIFKGGCRQLFWGLENINNMALNFMNKGIDKLLIDRCLKSANENGIENYCFILLGIPHIPIYTERETINYTINNTDIHIGIVGSFVVDRLSPVHLNHRLHKKYNIKLFEVGDLTTEVGYTQNSIDCRQINKKRTSEYIYELYSKRPDYALCSLLSEEIRLILTESFGNTFANEYISSVSDERIEEIIKKSIEYLIEERVIRRAEEVV